LFHACKISSHFLSRSGKTILRLPLYKGQSGLQQDASPVIPTTSTELLEASEAAALIVKSSAQVPFATFGKEGHPRFALEILL
jgi:hypothetical protein